MTREQLKSYLKTEAIASNFDANSIEDRVDQAVNFGLEEFWGAWNWYFKMKEVTFSVTTVETSYEAPKDFGGLIKIVDQGTSQGGDMDYLSKEEFDRRYPKPAAQSSGIPFAVTCFKDDGVWKLQFYPRPTSRDFNLVYEIDTAFAIETIPNNFTSGLLISCAKWIPMLSSQSGLVLEQRTEIIYRRLKLQNTTHKKPFNALALQGVTMTRLPVWADTNAFIS